MEDRVRVRRVVDDAVVSEGLEPAYRTLNEDRSAELVVRRDPSDPILPEIRLRQVSPGTSASGYVIEQFPNFARMTTPCLPQLPIILTPMEVDDLQALDTGTPDPTLSLPTAPVDPQDDHIPCTTPGSDRTPSPNWKERRRTSDPGQDSLGQEVEQDAPLL